MVAAFKPKLHEDDDDSEDLDELSTLEDESEEYIDCEDHDEAFYSLNRIACFSHTLQLVVNKFNELNKFKELLKRAHTIVRKVNSSTKATERLIALCRKKLVKDCPTRWSSTFLLLECLVDVSDSLKVVLEEQGWDDLATSE